MIRLIKCCLIVIRHVGPITLAAIDLLVALCIKAANEHLRG